MISVLLALCQKNRSSLSTPHGQKMHTTDKLQLKLHDEETNRSLIIDGVLMIRDAKSPTLVREMLLAYLPEKHRHAEEDDDDGAAEPAAA